MKKKDIAAVAASIRAVKTNHRELYALLSRLNEVFSTSEIDHDCDMAEPASALVAAFNLPAPKVKAKTVQVFVWDRKSKAFVTNPKAYR